jgi:hypothetical protein
MRRVMYIGGAVSVCSLSAFGAAELGLGLGLGPVLATFACIAAFLCNFFMIEPFDDIIRR